MANKTSYGAAAEEVRDLFAAYLEGGAERPVLALSFYELGEEPRGAIGKSLAALGFAGEACSWARVNTQAGGAKAATEGEGNDGGAKATAEGEGNADSVAETKGDTSESDSAVGSSAETNSTTAETTVAETTPAAETALDAMALRMLIEGLDPYRVIVTDDPTAHLLEEAYRTTLKRDAAGRLFGRTAAVFSDLGTLITTDEGKRTAWELFKALK